MPVIFFSVIYPALASDHDHDGVDDAIDQCPSTPQLKKHDKQFRYAALFSRQAVSSSPVSVAVDNTGCALDSDHDGVADHLDYCPNNTTIELSSGVSANGCPLQSDDDGTPDFRDRCPGTAMGVKTDRYGCPK